LTNFFITNSIHKNVSNPSIDFNMKIISYLSEFCPLVEPKFVNLTKIYKTVTGNENA